MPVWSTANDRQLLVRVIGRDRQRRRALVGYVGDHAGRDLRERRLDAGIVEPGERTWRRKARARIVGEPRIRLLVEPQRPGTVGACIRALGQPLLALLVPVYDHAIGAGSDRQVDVSARPEGGARCEHERRVHACGQRGIGRRGLIERRQQAELTRAFAVDRRGQRRLLEPRDLAGLQQRDERRQGETSSAPAGDGAVLGP